MVLGLGPIFPGIASTLSNDVGARVVSKRVACESVLMTYFQTFDGEGESRLSFCSGSLNSDSPLSGRLPLEGGCL